jgi:hypothetical protein
VSPVPGPSPSFRCEVRALATFNYIKAIWKNGPGVVSDAPDWVVATIERALPTLMSAHEREPVGVHLDMGSRLTLAIFVSPSALGGQNMLEDARHGSFIHVIASDHPDCRSLSCDEVRALFESLYGAPLSDSAVRQQRNFMLLDFPYHRELATDLFASKDLVEGGFGLGPSAPSSRAEAELAGPSPPAAPLEAVEPPAGGGDDPVSLSSLLGYRAGGVSERASDGLSFDQDLSYKEVVARLTYPLQAAPRIEPEHALGAVLDAAAVAAEEEGKPDLRNSEAAPVLERPAPVVARSPWSPIPVAVELVIVALLVGGFIALRLGDRGPVDQSQAESKALAEEMRGYTAPVVSSERELVELGGELDRGRKADVAPEIEAPELRPEMVPVMVEAELVIGEVESSLPVIEEADAGASAPAVVESESEAVLEGAPAQVAAIQVEEIELVREPAPAPREEAAVPEPVRELVVTSHVEALSPGPGTSVAALPSEVVPEPFVVLEELAPVSAAAEPELVAAQTEAFTEGGKASSDAAERDPGVVVTEALAESSSETAAEESAESGRDQALGVSAMGAEPEVEAVVAKPDSRGEDDQEEGRRKRERNRVMNQMQRYR